MIAIYVQLAKTFHWAPRAPLLFFRLQHAASGPHHERAVKPLYPALFSFRSPGGFFRDSWIKARGGLASFSF
jgi:hypothetical protein